MIGLHMQWPLIAASLTCHSNAGNGPWRQGCACGVQQLIKHLCNAGVLQQQAQPAVGAQQAVV